MPGGRKCGHGRCDARKSLIPQCRCALPACARFAKVTKQINGALPLAYPNNANKAADVICIVFIFVYAMGYSLGLGPAAWVYSSEVYTLLPVTAIFAREATTLTET